MAARGGMPQGRGGMPQGRGGGRGMAPGMPDLASNGGFDSNPVMSKMKHAAEMGSHIWMSKARKHALRAFYEGTDGEHWTTNTNWNVSLNLTDPSAKMREPCVYNLTLGDIETWDHITCAPRNPRRSPDAPELSARLQMGRPVQALLLEGVGLSGPLPTEIGKLVENKFLQHGQSGRLGGAISGLHRLLKVHRKAWGRPPHSGGEAARLGSHRAALSSEPRRTNATDSAASDPP